MEDDLTSAHMALPTPALKHLERFRSFLQSFYVQRHGYWPPHIVQPSRGKAVPLPKHTLLTMYTDFRNLYEFILDETSTSETVIDKDSLCGGLSTIEYMNAFSRKQKYAPLPFQLPLMPVMALQYPAPAAPASNRGLSLLTRLMGSKRNDANHRVASLAALQNATNVGDSKVMNSALVREYAHFEREYTLKDEEKISSADARNVRWINICAILQTLISVTQVPTEVIDVEGVDYPLCCQTAGTPPWKLHKTSSASTATSQVPSATYASTASDSPLETPPSPVSPSAQVPPLDLALVASRRLSTTSKNSLAVPPHMVPLPDTPPPMPTRRPSPCSPSFRTATPPPTIRTPSLGRRLLNRTRIPLKCPQPRKPIADIFTASAYASIGTSSIPPILAEHDLEASPTTTDDDDDGSVYSNDGLEIPLPALHGGQLLEKNGGSFSSHDSSSEHSLDPETPVITKFASSQSLSADASVWEDSPVISDHRFPPVPHLPVDLDNYQEKGDMSTMGVISVSRGPIATPTGRNEKGITNTMGEGTTAPGPIVPPAVRNERGSGRIVQCMRRSFRRD